MVKGTIRYIHDISTETTNVRLSFFTCFKSNIFNNFDSTNSRVSQCLFKQRDMVSIVHRFNKHQSTKLKLESHEGKMDQSNKVGSAMSPTIIMEEWILRKHNIYLEIKRGIMTHRSDGFQCTTR